MLQSHANTAQQKAQLVCLNRGFFCAPLRSANTNWGEKGAGQGEHRLIQHSSDTVRRLSVPRIERRASSSTARQSSKVGAVCGNAARPVLCGGRSAMIVPTATT